MSKPKITTLIDNGVQWLDDTEEYTWWYYVEKDGVTLYDTAGTEEDFDDARRQLDLAATDFAKKNTDALLTV